MARSSTLGRLFSTCLGSSSLRVAIVGSGPAGFYTAHQLLKKNKDVHVDILERLPVPFGLIRFGVSPDHPEVKNVINQFTTLAKSKRCRFIGNVSIGTDVSVAQLRSMYSAVVMAYGAEDDKCLGIPGENLNGVVSARAFVGWYNGLPSHANFAPNLTGGETAVIFGQGNVALDVARILLAPVDMLKATDICAHAFDALVQSRVRKVVIVGRRGPLQVAFTIKELREMTRIPKCLPVLNPKDFEAHRQLIAGLADLPRPRKRLTELMVKTADENRKPAGEEKLLELKFLRSPVEYIPSTPGSDCVGSIKLAINKLEGEGLNSRAVTTSEHEMIDCSLVLRSIGYKSLPIDPDIPFDKKAGTVPNLGGRIVDKEGCVIKGLYCSGWVKRGPVGVILNTMSDAFETADAVSHDLSKGIISATSESNDLWEFLCTENKSQPVSFADWERIDRVERRRGEVSGKPREKIVSIEEMMRIVNE